MKKVVDRDSKVIGVRYWEWLGEVLVRPIHYDSGVMGGSYSIVWREWETIGRKLGQQRGMGNAIVSGMLYTVELLANGFYLVTDNRSGLRGLYNADGSARSGDLSHTLKNAARVIRNRNYLAK